MITERGAALLIGAAFTWLLGRFLGVPELYVVAGAALALVGLAVAAVWLNATRIDVAREVSPERIPWGGRTSVALTLRNAGRLPLGLLLVSDEVPFTLADGPRFAVPALPRGAGVQLAYDLHGAGRGRYRVGPARIRLRDPFGLAERSRVVGDAGSLVVYPRVERLGSAVPVAPAQGDGSLRRRTLLHAGDEFSTIREWAPGDDIRLVHWPSSAHRARLMVRQFEQPFQPQATIFCDIRAVAHRGTGPESTMETAVTAAASVADHLHAHGHRLRLALPDDPADREADSVEHIMDRLAEAAPSARQPLGQGLTGLGGRGAGGLLVAVLAASSTGANGGAGDLDALMAAGRGYSVRIAMILDTADRAAARRPAEALAAGLQGAGWRTTVLHPGAPLSRSWEQVAGRAALAAGTAR